MNLTFPCPSAQETVCRDLSQRHQCNQQLVESGTATAHAANVNFTSSGPGPKPPLELPQLGRITHFKHPQLSMKTLKHLVCSNGGLRVTHHVCYCSGLFVNAHCCFGLSQLPQHLHFCHGLVQTPQLLMSERSVCTNKCINKALPAGPDPNTKCSRCFNLAYKSNCTHFCNFPKSILCMFNFSKSKIFAWRSRKGRKKVNVKKGYIVRRPK